MTEKKNPTPGKTAPTTTRKRTVAPPLDLSTLTVQPAEPPVRATGRNGNNPFVKVLQESWAARTQRGATEQGSGRKVVVPTANAQQVENLIRYAGNQLNLGTAIVSTPVAGGKQTEIVFCAKTRKQKKRTTESQ